MQRQDKDEVTRKIIQMTVDGKRNRCRPKLRWRDLVKEDMAGNQMTTAMAEEIGTQDCHYSNRHSTKCRGGDVRSGWLLTLL